MHEGAKIAKSKTTVPPLFATKKSNFEFETKKIQQKLLHLCTQSG